MRHKKTKCIELNGVTKCKGQMAKCKVQIDLCVDIALVMIKNARKNKHSFFTSVRLVRYTK